MQKTKAISQKDTVKVMLVRKKKSKALTWDARKDIHRFTLLVGYAVELGAAVGVTVGTRLAWQVARCDSTGRALVVLKEELEANGVGGTNATEELVPKPASSVMSSSS